MHIQTSSWPLELLWETTTNVQIKKSIFKTITTPSLFRWFTESLSFLIFQNIDTNLNSSRPSLRLRCQRGFELSLIVPDLDSGWQRAVNGRGLKRGLPGDVWTLVCRNDCPTNHSLAGWTAPCNEDTLELIGLSSLHIHSQNKQINVKD